MPYPSSQIKAPQLRGIGPGLAVFGLAAAFGIGSERSAAGPNGLSVFPSSALTARLRIDQLDSGYARLAVVGVLGDRGVRDAIILSLRVSFTFSSLKPA